MESQNPDKKATHEGASLSRLPARIAVAELVDSRYVDGKRPEQWEKRLEGIDLIKSEEGAVLKLWSDGGQSPPQAGWGIVLVSGDATRGYNWTLYSLPKGASMSDKPQVF